MNSLYQINQQIEELLSTSADENGEISDEIFALIELLQIDEKTKIDNIACYIKDLSAEQSAISAEIKALNERKKAKESKEDRLRKYLSDYLQINGQAKFETARAVLSFRKSAKVELVDESKVIDFAKDHQDLGLTKIDIITSKTAIGAALKSGISIPGAQMIETQNLQVK